MEPIFLTDTLSLKHINLENSKDMEMIKNLDADPIVTGPKGYLFPIINQAYRFQEKTSFYGNAYSLYQEEIPIGFLEISSVLQRMLTYKEQYYVNLCYAIIKEERRKGYATEVLREISKIILEDAIQEINAINLFIDKENVASKKVAEKAGFERLDRYNFDDCGFYVYTKQ